jgi:outer membrane protein assembly factor BamA
MAYKLPHGRAALRHASKIILWLSFSLGSEASVNTHLLVQIVTVQGTERPLQLQLETKVGAPLEISRVSRDVKRLWATGWFDDIRVEKSPVPGGVALRFWLTERQRYMLRSIRFEPRHFESRIALSPGTQVDRAALERQTRILTERLRASGYRHATVRFELTPAGIRQADVLFRVHPGRRYVIDRLEVSGFHPEDSEHVARALKGIWPRLLLPGIPMVSRGWKVRPQLDEEALGSALQRMRSSYISRGYLDATAVVEAIRFEGNLASISVSVQPGTAYGVESLQFLDRVPRDQTNKSPSQFPLKAFCDCLLAKRAEAERVGVSDFGVELIVRPTHPAVEPATQPRVSLTARTHQGPPQRVRTIEFRGNHHISDTTLRRALLLSEGDWFDRGLLRRSLTRLNLTGLIHPLSELDVQVQPNLSQDRVDLVIPVRERDRGRWSLGAPLQGGLFRSAWFSISSRLPNWGQSYLELPTYFVAFSVTSPLGGLPLSVFNQAHLSVSLAHPYLPGRGWRSGFQVSPQASWHHMLLASGLHQVKPRLSEWLQPEPSLPIQLSWNTALPGEGHVLTSGILMCEPPRKPFSRMLTYVQTGADWLFPIGF